MIGTSTSLSTANAAPTWPIRVGGIYPWVESKNITHRVTHILDGRVIFEHWSNGECASFATSNLTEGAFRSLSLPEDQSPIPDMLAALKAAEWVEFSDSDHGNVTFCPVCRNDKKYGHYDGCQLAAAIAKAEGR